MAQHGTQLYDAIYLASNELMKKQAGRKAIIILSDGVDRGSKTYLDGAIEAAQRADTMIYCIYFAEPRRDNRNDHDDQAGGNGRGGGGYPAGVGVAAGPVVEAAVGRAEVAAGEAGGVDSVIPKSLAPTARSSSSRFRRKPVDGSLKPRRNKPLARFTTASSKNCARSTTSAIRPIKTVRHPAFITFR